MKLEKNRIFILQLDLENPRPNQQLWQQKISSSFRKRKQERWWRIQ